MNDWELLSLKEVQALCGIGYRFYVHRKLIFTSKITRSNNNVMKACFYNNFCR